MSYDTLRPAALEWDAIQRTRIMLNNMLRAFERQKRTVPPWLDDAEGPGGMLQLLERQETAALRAVRRAMEGDEWLVRLREFVESTMGLGPAIFCIVGLLPPLINFPNPAKLWKYLGLHVLTVLTDQSRSDTQIVSVGRAPKRPTCGPICKEKDCPHDRWSFSLKAYAITRVVPSIIKCMESPYRPVYDERKVRTHVTHPEWRESKKAPKMHYERDAQRIVAKRVWRDVWRAAHGQRQRDTQATPAGAAQPLHGDHQSSVTHPTSVAMEVV